MLIALAGVCAIMVRFLRDITFHVGPSSIDPYVITASEIVPLLYAVCAVALAAPRMPDVDLRRIRAQWLAVGRYATAALLVAGVASFAAYQVKVAYFLEMQSFTRVLLSSEGGGPESELIVNNSLLLLAIAGIAITLLGKLRGVIASIVLWMLANSPLLFTYDLSPWPFDILEEEGPWVSWPHIGTTAVVFLAAFLVEFRTAGASAVAAREDK
ncbi:hypothetical protein [Corynebacterium liangguodongii]|uniref:hypothetical protein n=1 Tax=Corynebacterium liangguodongii TaxID=2079535 RepID=UPI0011B1FD1E|nr:hypothetical protein [Corynebacterium liangguodongii]